jgi:hypothetical protein
MKKSIGVLTMPLVRGVPLWLALKMYSVSISVEVGHHYIMLIFCDDI